MTQKATLFKGQQKRKTIPSNRHGKSVQTRKGKRNVKPAKYSKDTDTDREISKFINHCNEVKFATAAKQRRRPTKYCQKSSRGKWWKEIGVSKLAMLWM